PHAHRVGRPGPDHPGGMWTALPACHPRGNPASARALWPLAPVRAPTGTGTAGDRVYLLLSAASGCCARLLAPPNWRGYLRYAVPGQEEHAMTNTQYYYFTEQPYTGYDPAIQEEYPALRLTLPNSLYDAKLASELYNRYHDEYQVADEAGFDGIMINEHHTAPFCMQASINITVAVLAKITRLAKIVMLGNPLAVVDNPLRLAEELAMIDCISRGRLISGFVRGGGVESLANNINPAHNRERFEEAHDVILAAWTRPGPFRWEGKHFQYRVINPWALPLQKPHPPIMVPGTASPETVVWAAKHRYPYIVLG